jgi:hypothetical protein
VIAPLTAARTSRVLGLVLGLLLFVPQQPMQPSDGTHKAVVDPCQGQTKLFASINQTTTTQILAASGAGVSYWICSLHLVTATAQNVAIIDSATAGNACATSPAGSSGFGGSTAATGWNFAANGGIAYGEGGFSIGQTSTTNRALCVAQSGSGQLSGGFSYVSQ